VIVKFGIFNSNEITLSLSFPPFTTPRLYTDPILISGSVLSSNSSDLLTLLVVDDDTSRISRLNYQISVNLPF
jgi:hypothetical protein